MADSGLKSGQDFEVAIRLIQSSTPLSYASKAAFESAGWAVSYRASQSTVAFSYTLAPHPVTALANAGWHVMVISSGARGVGTIQIVKPTTGVGWQVDPEAFMTALETNGNDDIYTLISSTSGAIVAGTSQVSATYTMIEGQSFSKTLSVQESALTAWGYTATSLTDGTLSLHGEIRSGGNALGIPNAYWSISVDTAVDGSNPVLRLSLPEYPAAAVTDLIEGMIVASTDASTSAITFRHDVEARGTNSIAISAVSTGLGGSFTLSGDQRRWFNIGMTFTVSGSTGNDGDWTCSAVTYGGTNTVVSVIASENITNAVADGNAIIDIEIPLVKGTVTVQRGETRN